MKSCRRELKLCFLQFSQLSIYAHHWSLNSRKCHWPPQGGRLAVDWKLTEKRKVSSGTLTPRFTIPKENCESKSPPGANKSEDGGRNSNQAPATGVAKPVPRPPTQQAPCTAEIKTIGAFPPLMRAVSWDAIGGINSRNGAEDTSSDKARDGIFKSPGLKELPAPKLSKFREVKHCSWNFMYCNSFPTFTSKCIMFACLCDTCTGAQADAQPNHCRLQVTRLE